MSCSSMLQGPHARMTRLARAVGSLAALAGLGLLAMPGAALAKPPVPKPPKPRAFVAAAINVHNAYADQTFDEFVAPNGPFASELEFCQAVAAESGDPRTINEATLRDENSQNADRVRKDWGEYNDTLAEERDTFAAYKHGLKKKKRKKLKGALKNLDRAHDGHKEEFFHLAGSYVQMENASLCDAAVNEKNQGALVGSTAWTAEFKGLHALAKLFGVKKPAPSDFLGPYNR